MAYEFDAEIVSNIHPTEEVGVFHATAVKRILEEKYGRKILLTRIPDNETVFGLLTRGTPRKAAEAILQNYRAWWEKSKARPPAGAPPVFEFHATKAEDMGKAASREPGAFKVGKEFDRFMFEINREILFIEANGLFMVEMPAIFLDLPEEKRRKREARIREVMQAGVGVVGNNSQLESLLQPKHHLVVASLAHSGQKKYLSGKISEKIAAQIDEIIEARKRQANRR